MNLLASLRQAPLAAYRRLVDEIATSFEGRDEGLYDVKQIRDLTPFERALILKSNPDAINNVNIDPDQIAEVLEGLVDPGAWLFINTEGLLRQQLFEDVAQELARGEENRALNEADEMYQLRSRRWALGRVS
jgi:hypothetical protein